MSKITITLITLVVILTWTVLKGMDYRYTYVSCLSDHTNCTESIKFKDKYTCESVRDKRQWACEDYGVRAFERFDCYRSPSEDLLSYCRENW